MSTVGWLGFCTFEFNMRKMMKLMGLSSSKNGGKMQASISLSVVALVLCKGVPSCWRCNYLKLPPVCNAETPEKTIAVIFSLAAMKIGGSFWHIFMRTAVKA